MIAGSLAAKLRSVHAWRELAGLLFIPADVIWLAGWFCLLTGVIDSRDMAHILGVFVLCSFLAYLFLRVLNSWQVPGGLRLLLGGAGMLIGIWLGENLLIYQRLVLDPQKVMVDIWSGFSGLRSLSDEFWALIGMSVVWLRGILYTRKPVTQDTVLGRLQFDLAMILISLVFPTRPGLVSILIGLSLFLVLSLSSLSLARIADINFYRGGKRLPFKLDWLAALVGISTCLVVIAGSFAFLASRWLSLVVIALTNGILEMLRFIVEKLFMPLVMAVLAIIQKLLDLFYKPVDDIKIPKLNLEAPSVITGLKPLEIEQSSAEVLKAAQPYILAILLGLVVVGVILVILKKPWKEQLKEVDNSSREQVEGSVWKWLRNSLGLRIQTVLGSVAGKGRFRRAAGLFRAARIRWIYHQLELHSARKGVPRPVAVTPLEYRSMLVTVFPGGDDDLTVLTRAYLSVRYGELPEIAQEVTEVADAWDRLRVLKPVRDERPVTRRQKP